MTTKRSLEIGNKTYLCIYGAYRVEKNVSSSRAEKQTKNILVYFLSITCLCPRPQKQNKTRKKKEGKNLILCSHYDFFTCNYPYI